MTVNNANFPLVSIVLPTYNRADFIVRAIASVHRQSYQNWELIIWDDGSTDNTPAIVGGFIDNRIQYYSSHNCGAAHARNQALAHAQGEFIAFLDSDDEWLDDKLSAQILFLLEHPEIDLVFSDFENIDESCHSVESWFNHSMAALRRIEKSTLNNDFHEIITGFPETTLISNYIGTPTVVLRRRCLMNDKYIFNETLRNAEDYELWWRLGINRCRIAYSNRILTKRYRLESNLSRPGAAYWISHINALELCFEHARRAGHIVAFPLLRKQLQNAWLKLALSFRNEKQSKIRVIRAYIISCRFGINRKTFAFLVRLVLSQTGIGGTM